MTTTLHLGDCLDILATLPSGSVDAVIADPPYGTTTCKWDSVIPFDAMWAELRRVAKPNAAIVLFAAQPFTSALVMSNPQEFRHEWIWQKSRASNFAFVRHAPLRYHEAIAVFSSRQVRYNPEMVAGEPYLSRVTKRGMVGKDATIAATERESRSTRYPASVIPFPSMRQQDRVHPTQKPVDLLAYLVRTYTHPGDTVLDFCMGSGTTGVACVQEGRDFIGIEREPTYYEISERRIAAAQPPLPLAEAAD